MTQGGHKAATDHVQPGILAVEVGRRFGIQQVELQRLSRIWVWGRGSKEVKAHPGPLDLLLPLPGMLFPKWILIQSFTC